MNIQWKGSPNYTAGRGGNKVSGIIMHWIVGNLASADAQFQKPGGVSATEGIEDDNVHQYVAEENTAYHAGDFPTNQRTIGIEHSAAPGRSPSEATYETSGQRVAYYAKKYGFEVNNQTVRSHSTVVATRCSGSNADGTVREAGGLDINRIIRRAKNILGVGGGEAPAPNPAPQPPASTTFAVGDLVSVVNPVDYNGTRLGVSGSYVVMESKGDRVVIGRNGAVTAAMRASSLSKAGSGVIGTPAPSGGSIGVGSNVTVSNPVDVNGTRLATFGVYTVVELNGSRAVIGRDGAITAAINVSNLALVGGGTAAPAPQPASISVGDNVVVTNPVDYNGTPLAVRGIYKVMELRGDRAVIGINGQVTAAINVKNLRRA